MPRFAGKTVVITGASRGIGAALAKRFAREGASVVASANEPACEQVADAILKAGGKAVGFVADVTKKGEVIALYDLAERTFGEIDISIQNAGIITIARIEAMPETEWDKVMEVNTKGVFLCCQEAIARNLQAQARRTPHQHRLRPGAPGFHLYAPLRRLEVRRGRSDLKSRQGSGERGNHGQRVLPRHYRHRHVGL